ncbi:DUF4365 domain-containing protein [Actinospica sp. MGRD01-02]|uniref:DUF4365 domain-containing protein n=1 Tax=Actinospica acidithermotolerans TaxID=2828514 RepID=A0A941IJE3_9ACTN|nr:DUF4365 domain-containing protein [Actinospica acidithermotolerans]MBR7830655.1 DUF4365 domain-containing protein [Actinospica acidithermotolerans]
MKRKASARVGSAAVTHTQMAVEDELGWLFRGQSTEDYGIDAHAEVVDGEYVRGRLLALQIKGGESWFGETAPEGWWFRPDVEHVQYWTNHSLPVAVVLYHPGTQKCHWQLVNPETLVKTSGGGWKLRVPAAQVLDRDAVGPLLKAAEGDPYELRLRELRLAKPWMERLASGSRLLVDFEEWINKSSGRGTISIGVDREDGNEPEELATWHFLVGPANYAEAVPRLFAWANADVHAETYDEAEYDQYEAECSVWDEDDQFFTETFDDWRQTLIARGIRPYRNGAGEVDFFRLELALNELGKAFLVVDRFAMDGGRQLTG